MLKGNSKGIERSSMYDYPEIRDYWESDRSIRRYGPGDKPDSKYGCPCSWAVGETSLMRPRLVMGLGSGRCGTYSLYRLLEAQKGFISIHEGFYLPWYDIDLLTMWRHLERLRVVGANVHSVATTSFVWINYIPEIMAHMHKPRCICLRRSREETVDSFETRFPTFNLFTARDCKHWKGQEYEDTVRLFQWPKYSLPRKEATGAYWDEYYEKAEYWAGRYPDCFRIFNIEDLNTETGVTAILNFAGVWDEEMVSHVGVRLNTRFKTKGRIENV